MVLPPSPSRQFARERSISRSEYPQALVAATQQNKRERHWWTSALAGFLLLVTPLVVFLRFQDYSLLRPESIATLAILGLLGAFFGLAMEIFGAWSRALMFSMLITLTVDIQSTSPDRLRLLLIVFVVSFSLTGLLRDLLPRWGSALLIVSFLLSCFGPSSKNVLGIDADRVASPGDPELPVIVHLVLDEHIGVEGIPEEFDQQGHYARALRETYLKHDFRVFGRAFSRFYNTYNTIPNMFNYDTPTKTRAYVNRRGNDWYLTENAYFNEMSARGYAIHVFQSKYLDYLSKPDSVVVDWGWTFDPERLTLIQGMPLSALEKARSILGMYSRLSSMAEPLNLPVSQTTPVATLPALDLVRDKVIEADPGTLFFAHLLLPHGPYGLTSDCEIRPAPTKWLSSSDPAMAPRRNNKGSRFMRYPLYLQQLECLLQRIDDFLLALEESPQGDNIIVVVHGDHGSRLDCGPPEHKLVSKLARSDWADGFSTLFAIKHPNVPAGYDRRAIAIDEIFFSVVHDDSIPGGSEWFENPEVYLEQRNSLKPHPLPPFERSLDDDL